VALRNNNAASRATMQQAAQQCSKPRGAALLHR
jgi:hypothetical protein